MFGLFSGGGNDGPLTDRGDIIKVLQMVSNGDTIEFQPKFGERRKMHVRSATGQRIEVGSFNGNTSRLINTDTGMLLDPTDETEYGIEKLWPTDSMRQMLSQMES